MILGGAACVHDDAARALALFTPHMLVAVNNIGIDWPGQVDHWVTLHPRKTGTWPGMVEAVKQREAAGRNRPATWSHQRTLGIEHVTQGDWGGSSGLLAVKVALVELKCAKVVLAGIPMDDQPHYFGPPWRSASAFQRGWDKHRAKLANHVRSMSGKTRQWFGEPTLEWIENGG